MLNKSFTPIGWCSVLNELFNVTEAVRANINKVNDECLCFLYEAITTSVAVTAVICWTASLFVLVNVTTLFFQHKEMFPEMWSFLTDLMCWDWFLHALKKKIKKKQPTEIKSTLCFVHNYSGHTQTMKLGLGLGQAWSVLEGPTVTRCCKSL